MIDIRLNGVDPEGEHAPDEILQPRGREGPELVRERDGWHVTRWIDGDQTRDEHYDEDFEQAFVRFCQLTLLEAKRDA